MRAARDIPQMEVQKGRAGAGERMNFGLDVLYALHTSYRPRWPGRCPWAVGHRSRRGVDGHERQLPSSTWCWVDQSMLTSVPTCRLSVLTVIITGRKYFLLGRGGQVAQQCFVQGRFLL